MKLTPNRDVALKHDLDDVTGTGDDQLGGATDTSSEEDGRVGDVSNALCVALHGVQGGAVHRKQKGVADKACGQRKRQPTEQTTSLRKSAAGWSCS